MALSRVNLHPLMVISCATLCMPLVLVMLGCPSPPNPPDDPVRCGSSTGVATWTPDRIELLDMDDMRSLDVDANVGRVSGGQGADMVGFYIAVYGDEIPECLSTTISLADTQSGDWVFESDGTGRAQMSNPAYWVWYDGGGPNVVSVQIGEMNAEFDIDIY
jgi:hypothetical protein